ncbi:hypothetical protein [Phenylobacterium sp.]|uniref:hypothetical protein n=1 Tax=Phenylobacterium sp. TaxID=1871053 RepID=UPI0030F4AE75
MARMPNGEPRSVPDINDEDYDEMIRRQAANNARAAGEPEMKSGSGGRIGHPGELESLIPVWGSGREALADFEDGDYIGAGLNGALAVSDLAVAGSLGKGLVKGGVFIANKATRRAAPYGWKGNVRTWMGEQKFLKPGQHGHHWAIPQNEGWGKAVPDFIKNQPWNIKPMPSPQVHGRIHGRYGGQPQFKPAQRYWYGTPAWSKWATGSAVGHPAMGAAEQGRRSK